MTLLLERSRPARPAAPAAGARPRVRWPGRPCWYAAGLMALAALLRFPRVSASYDVFVDEFFYADMSASVRHGNFPPDLPNGQPFLLHPPGFFGLGAAWQALWGDSGDQFSHLLLLRYLNATLAVLSAGLVFALARRLGGTRAGVLVALVFALDPYTLRQNGRVLLETAVMTFLLAGYLVLMPVVQGRSRRPTTRALAAGVLLGLAIMVKDMAAVLVVVPLLVAVLSGWIRPRRAGWLALAAASIPYLRYLLYLSVHGLLGAYLDAKLLGGKRLIGMLQISGFNQQGAPSLLSSLGSQVITFVPTCLLTGLGLVVAVRLITRRRSDLRLLGLITVAAGAEVGYATLFGTSEEHFLYLLWVVALISLVVAVAEGRPRHHRPVPRPVRLGLATALAVLLLADLGQWAAIRSTSDNSLQRAVLWLQGNAAPGDTVLVTTAGAEFALRGTGLHSVRPDSRSDLVAQHARYAILPDKLIAQGYAYVTPETAAWLHRYGRVVCSFRGRSFGTMSVVETTDPGQW